jgi:hypothetical protein
LSQRDIAATLRAVAGHPNLVNVDVSYNGVSSLELICPNIGQVERLETLDLSGNHLWRAANLRKDLVRLLTLCPALGWIGKEFYYDSLVYSREAEYLMDFNRVGRGRRLCGHGLSLSLWPLVLGRVTKVVKDYADVGSSHPSLRPRRDEERTVSRQKACQATLIFSLLTSPAFALRGLWRINDD